jgi:hypothetical protein
MGRPIASRENALDEQLLRDVGGAAAQGAANDPGPVVHLDPRRADAIPVEQFYAGVVADCADRMTALARHRTERAWRLRSSREARILHQRDAIVATGQQAARDVCAWWHDAGSRSGWGLWSACFVLESLGTREAVHLVQALLEAVDEGTANASALGGEALAMANSGEFLRLATDLVKSSSAVARAAGIEALSLRGIIPASGLILRLEDQSPLVVAAAIRGLSRLPGELPEAALARIDNRDNDVAWEAARAGTLRGHRDAYHSVLEAPRRWARDAARGAELLVMLGQAADIETLQVLICHAAVDEALLRAVGRFGHATSWSFLCHYLLDETLCSAAEDALVTLFGPCVAEKERRQPGAWRAALAEADLSPSIRYRHGQPWSPQVVAAECGAGAIDRTELERRLDEVAVRTGTRMPLPCIGGWTGAVDASVSGWMGQVVGTGRSYRAGSWEVR